MILRGLGVRAPCVLCRTRAGEGRKNPGRVARNTYPMVLVAVIVDCAGAQVRDGYTGAVLPCGGVPGNGEWGRETRGALGVLDASGRLITHSREGVVQEALRLVQGVRMACFNPTSYSRWNVSSLVKKVSPGSASLSRAR